MNADALISKEILLQILEESPFEHMDSSVHVMDSSAGKGHELAGVSIYGNERGWTAQINWRAVIEADEITLRVGDGDTGERAYELRDEHRSRIAVGNADGAVASPDEISAVVAKSRLARSWESDVLGVLRDTRERQATIH